MYTWIARLGISAACYRLSHTWWGAALMHIINAAFFDREHCRKAFENPAAAKGQRHAQ
jgi:hypothetical protein